jgi:hypothetical protein
MMNKLHDRATAPFREGMQVANAASIHERNIRSRMYTVLAELQANTNGISRGHSAHAEPLCDPPIHQTLFEKCSHFSSTLSKATWLFLC